MGKDVRTIYWHNREEKRKEDPTTWRGHGGTYKLLDYNQDTGQGLVMSDIGPKVMDLRDMNTADAAKKAMIANYTAAERYPEADPNSKITDLLRDQKLWERGFSERAYADELADATNAGRQRPVPGTINGVPENTFMSEPPAPGDPRFIGPLSPHTSAVTPTATQPVPGAFAPVKPDQFTPEMKERYSIIKSLKRHLWPGKTEF